MINKDKSCVTLLLHAACTVAITAIQIFKKIKMIIIMYMKQKYSYVDPRTHHVLLHI